MYGQTGMSYDLGVKQPGIVCLMIWLTIRRFYGAVEFQNQL